MTAKAKRWGSHSELAMAQAMAPVWGSHLARGWLSPDALDALLTVALRWPEMRSLLLSLLAAAGCALTEDLCRTPARRRGKRRCLDPSPAGTQVTPSPPAMRGSSTGAAVIDSVRHPYRCTVHAAAGVGPGLDARAGGCGGSRKNAVQRLRCLPSLAV